MYGGGTWNITALICRIFSHFAHPVQSCRADEVNAVVLDLGSYQVKAGYAGDDAPKYVFPSVREGDCWV